MARSKSYKKNIVCLESFWNHDIENRLSVAPILELLSRRNGIKSTLLTCNTQEELGHNLNLFKKKKDYGILYLAFHGKPGKIILDGSSVDMETLAGFMGKSFSHWIVYFGNCATINVKERRIFNFMKSTGILMLMGYDRPIDWLSSTALDLLLLDCLQYYRDMRKFWNFFGKNYQGMAEIIGLKAFHK
ncbi:MAG: hypothetical protein A2157_07450 [Deltaproteobacteria bacterium RBG_16_47_11]|nr:MAG: hypothetical protein A2157_07450 [Deltaproteobacteria bacterium RBG_16_47_11]